jgi:hypothetical protein
MPGPTDDDPKGDTKKSRPGDNLPDDRQAETLRDTLTRDLSASGRIGLGLKALYNHPLLEKLPAEFRLLLKRLQARNRADGSD